MKNVLLGVCITAIFAGCGKNNNGPMLNEPAGKNRANVVMPGEYPGGTNVQGHDNTSIGSTNRQPQQPFGTDRANSGSYESTNTAKP
jgi:hypothetical protein